MICLNLSTAKCEQIIILAFFSSYCYYVRLFGGKTGLYGVLIFIADVPIDDSLMWS
jgi:hypothetical protein